MEMSKILFLRWEARALKLDHVQKTKTMEQQPCKLGYRPTSPKACRRPPPCPTLRPCTFLNADTRGALPGGSEGREAVGQACGEPFGCE